MAAISKYKTRKSELPSKGVPRHTIGTPATSRLEWEINWWLLLGTVLAVALVVPLAHFWHSYQLDRHADVFLTRANVLEDDQQWVDAAQLVERYLRVYPENAEARVRLAQIFDKVAEQTPSKIPTSERLYSVAVGLAPDRAALRMRHAHRLLQLGRFGDALAEVEEAIKQEPGNSEALRMKAVTSYGDARARGDFSDEEDLIKRFQAAIAACVGTQEHVDLALQLANMYRRDLVKLSVEVRRSQADQVVDEMVNACTSLPAAWIGRYLYRVRNDGVGSDEDLNRALQVDTEHSHATVQLAAAERAKGLEELDAAGEYYLLAIAAQPANARSYLGLAQLESDKTNVDQAIATLKRGLEAVGESDIPILELTLASTYLAAGTLDDADDLLKLIAKQLETQEGRLPRGGVSPLRSTLDALRGQWYLEKRQYSQAALLLKHSVMGISSVSAKQDVVSRAQAYMQLGRCYTALKHWDQAASAFKEAATLLPQVLAPQFAAAKSWQAAGRLDEAVREFRQATLRLDATDEVWASLIEAQTRQQVTAVEKQRNWESVEDSLAEGEKRFPESKLLATLRTQLQDLRRGTRNTLKLLEEAQAAEPQSVRMAEGLIIAYEQEGSPQKADEVLKAFTASNKNEADVFLLRATLLVARNEFVSASRMLTDFLSTAPTERQDEIKFRLAGIAMRAGKLKDARDILAELVSRADRNEVILELLADLAVETKDLKDLAYWEEELKKQEGPEGTGWRYYRAQRLISEALGASDPRLAETEQLINEIVKLRPMWSIGLVLQGQLAERRAQPERAIEAYRKAIDMGERRTYVREQLAALLFATNQTEEVEQYLQELGDAVARSPQLANIAISLRILRGDSATAVDLARKEISLRPQDPLSYIALGQALLAAKEISEAGDTFRQATTISPGDLRTWQALFGFYVSMKQTDEARHTLVEAAKVVNRSEKDLLPVFAVDQVLMGDEHAAAQSNRRLLEIAPDDAKVQERAAMFFADRDPALAERCLRRWYELQPQARPPRLALASFLISRGGDARLFEADQLLIGLSPESKVDPLVQGQQARLMLRRGEADDHEGGKKLLEDLLARGEATNDDRATLVNLYQAEGRIRQAQETAHPLANRKNPQPRDLARYVDLLLQDNRAAEATPWLKKLVEVDPVAFTTVSLRARLLVSEGHGKDVEPLIEDYMKQRLGQIESAADRSKLLLAVGKLYSQLRMEPQAEHAYRHAMAQNATNYAALATWLASHGKLSEAVELCLSAAATDATPQAATTLTSALVFGNADRETALRVETTLQHTLQTHADNADFLMSLANWRLMEEKNEDAVAILRKVLAADPRDLMALNNLATALAENSATSSEAKELIDRAIAQAGPLVELLDTKGTVLLASGDADGAVNVLREAVSRSSTDPRHFFHLAMALRQAGKLPESREALRQARKLAIDSAVMTPKHRQLLSELEQGLEG